MESECLGSVCLACLTSIDVIIRLPPLPPSSPHLKVVGGLQPHGVLSVHQRQAVPPEMSQNLLDELLHLIKGASGA